MAQKEAHAIFQTGTYYSCPGASSLLWSEAILFPPPPKPRRVTDTTAVSNPNTEKSGDFQPPAVEILSFWGTSKFTAEKRPEEDCRNQSGELSKPSALATP